MRRPVVPLLLCSILLVVPLVSLRNSQRAPSTNLAAGVDLTHRAAPRATRSAWRAAPTTTTTEAPTTTTASTVLLTVATVRTTPTTAKAVKLTTTTTVRRTTTTTAPPAPSNSQTGKASWYAQAPDGTCAHQTLPMGTIVKVTNTANGKSTTCRVADRGPYHDGWIIDLAESTFAQLAPTSTGVISVRIEW